MQLLCDLRERYVLPLFPKLDHIIHKTLVIGDYAICDGEIMYFVFERKTWSDLAASIKDGRIEAQLNKIKELTCPKFVIIEGKMQYHPEHVIGGIEFSKLDAYKRRMMMEGIQIVQTKNEYHTVEFLVAFTEQFSRTRPAVRGGNVKEITEKKKMTIGEQVDELWRSFPGIGPNLLPTMRTLTIREFINMKPEKVAELKYLSGRCVGLATANKMLSPLFDGKKAEKVLSAIYGISKNGAAHILKQVSFGDFMNGKTEVHLNEKKRLGDIMQGRIHELLNYKVL